MNNRKILLVLLIGFPLFLFSQENDSIVVEKEEYIVRHDGYLFTRLSINNYTESFEVLSDQIEYKIQPNTSYKLKLNAGYRFIAFSAAFSPGFIPGNNDDTRKGKSKVFSMGMTFYIKNWIQNVSFNRTKGFYLVNTADFVPNWDESSDDYIQFPELLYLGFYGHTAYKFNPNFSLKAITNQSEHQVKSAGSFIPLLSYKYYIVDNQVELTGQNSSQKTNNFEANLQLGYFYTLVISKRFYISGAAAGGGGFIYTKLLTRMPDGNYTNQNTNLILRFEGQLALGYQSERFFAGGQLINTWQKYTQTGSATAIVDDVITFQVFVGYRFRAPKFVKSSVENIPMPGK